MFYFHIQRSAMVQLGSMDVVPSGAWVQYTEWIALHHIIIFMFPTLDLPLCKCKLLMCLFSSGWKLSWNRDSTWIFHFCDICDWGSVWSWGFWIRTIVRWIDILLTYGYVILHSSNMLINFLKIKNLPCPCLVWTYNTHRVTSKSMHNVTVLSAGVLL